MAAFDERTIDEIKQRIELSELIASYGIAVRRAGSSVKACCPFHHEKTPSFNINDAKGFYHCFGCGESGDAIKFVQKQEGLTFVEAVKKLAERCGVKIEEAAEDPELGLRKRLHALLAELAQFYHRCLLKTKEAELARKYLAERALAGQTADDYLIGYAPNGVAVLAKWAAKYGYTLQELEQAGVVKAPNRPGDQGYHRFGGRLMFTIRDRQGRVVGFSGRQLVASKNSGKYVNSPETAVFKKSNVLYGFDKAAAAIAKAPHREAIVCEGQIDCIRLQTSGFPNAVAGQGTAFTEEHVRMLAKVGDQVALVYDDDGAGHKATVKSARLCLAAGLPVRVVSLPDGDDPDSFLRRHPAEDFRKMLDEAESVMSFQVRAERLKEAHPDTVDAVNRITHEILVTIAACPGAVLRAGMVGEAAKLLKLPAAALEEELARVRVEASAPHRTVGTDPRSVGTDPVDRGTDPTSSDAVPSSVSDDTVPPVPGDDARLATPPSARERALMAFLLANEADATLDGMLGEFLPAEIFAHDFTRRFVEAWRQGAASGEDAIGTFAAALSPRERPWFDALLAESGISVASTLSPTDILQDFVRTLWSDRLRRERGQLPAMGDDAADLRRMELSAAIKRLALAKWHDVKDLVRTWRGSTGPT